MMDMSTSPADVSVLIEDLQLIFGARLISVLTYGIRTAHAVAGEPVKCLVLVSSLGAEDLEGCGRRCSAWHQEGLATPLVLVTSEMERALEAFPLEFGEIIRRHALAFGSNPFASMSINTEATRRACNTQVQSHLVHVRESFIEAQNSPKQVDRLLADSAPAFASLLRQVAWLQNEGQAQAAAEDGALALAGARLAGLQAGIVDTILGLEYPASGSTDAARLFPDYLVAVERLALYIDGAM